MRDVLSKPSWENRQPMDLLTDDCSHCRSAGSIEFGLCQVCLREQGPSAIAEPVVITLPDRAVSV